MLIDASIPRANARLGRPESAIASRLLMSDYCFLAGLGLALCFVTDPLDWGLERQLATKHLPLALALAGVVLVSLGSVLFPRINAATQTQRWPALHGSLPLVLLALAVLTGSLHARNYSNITGTFLNVGLYMLFVPLAARTILLSPARNSIVGAFLAAAAAVSVFMVLRMVSEFRNGGAIYHELEGLIIPLAVYFALLPGRSKWRNLMAIFFLASAFVFRKNTGFLVLAVTLCYLWLVEWRFRFRESVEFRRYAACWIFVLLIAIGLAVAYWLVERANWMPSGNPEYRLSTYDIAWHRFLDSPLWGTAFSAAGAEKFTGYDIAVSGGVLPTHSDLLDLAANGGMAALALWLWGYVRIWRLASANVLSERVNDKLSAAAHTFACMSIAGIVVYAFNPILLQPAKALLLWAQLGMLLGIALYRGREHAARTGATP